MRRATIALLLAALPAHAQDWATPEVCTVEEAVVSPETFAPHGRQALDAEAAAIPNGIGRLWRVETPDGAVSHLWGTYHSSNRLILDIPDTALDILRSSRVVAGEIDFRFADRGEMLRSYEMEGRFREFGMLPDPPRYAPLPGADPRIEGWITDRVAAVGYRDGTGDAISFFTPGGLAELLLGDPCEDLLNGIPPIQDDYLVILTHVAGLPFVGLEEPDDLIQRLNADYPTAQAMITAYGAYLEPVEDNAHFATSIALYREGLIGLSMALDHAFLRGKLGDGADAANARMDDYLVRERNRIFIEAAAPLLRDGGAFIAVGSFHLPGELGMIELLRAAGHKVTRIPLPGEAA